MIALNLSTINDAPLDRAVVISEHAGFKYVELRLPSIDDYLEHHSLNEFIALFNQTGIRALSINSIEKFNSVDGGEFDAVLAATEKYARLASWISCPYLIFVPQPEDSPWAEVKLRTVDRLKEVTKICERYGVRALLEFIGFKQFTIRTYQQAVEIVRAINGHQVGLVFDTFHFFLSGGRLQDLSSDDVTLIAIVHLDDIGKGVRLEDMTDEARDMPGLGCGNLTGIVGKLIAEGCDAPYSVELFGSIYSSQGDEAVSKMAYEHASVVVNRGLELAKSIEPNKMEPKHGL